MYQKLKGQCANRQFKRDSARVAFWYALVLVLKCYAVTLVLRASPLNWALVAKAKNAAKAGHLGLMVCAVFA